MKSYILLALLYACGPAEVLVDGGVIDITDDTVIVDSYDTGDTERGDTGKTTDTVNDTGIPEEPDTGAPEEPDTGMPDDPETVLINIAPLSTVWASSDYYGHSTGFTIDEEHTKQWCSDLLIPDPNVEISWDWSADYYVDHISVQWNELYEPSDFRLNIRRESYNEYFDLTHDDIDHATGIFEYPILGNIHGILLELKDVEIPTSHYYCIVEFEAMGYEL